LNNKTSVRFCEQLKKRVSSKKENPARYFVTSERRHAMIPKIKKILYATDLSTNSAYAMRYALNSARNHDAKIIMLHVVEEMPATTQMLISAYMNEEKLGQILERNILSVKEQIAERMKKFYEKELQEEPELRERIESVEVSEGFPAEEILKKADELGCDVIVMGTHGKGFLKNAFLGSTTRRVLRRVRKPVYIIPLPKEKNELSDYSGDDPDE
jgi:nucleotide-binding universal stress UspA family protein